jgi:hypothetical protein
VLRAIEQGARETRKLSGEGPTSYLTTMGRMLQVNQAAQAAPGPAQRPASSIVLP